MKQAVILAAGESSRFYPYNSLGHKSLTTISGKTAFERTIESLVSCGILEIIIVESEKKALSSSIHGKDFGNVKFTFLTQAEANGMGEALLLAKSHLSSSFFVLSSYHFEFSEYYKDFLNATENAKDLVILTKSDSDVSQFGAIVTESGKTKVSEKEKGGERGSRIVSIYKLTQDFLTTLENTPKHHYSFEDAISAYDAGDIILLDAKNTTLSLKFPWDALSMKDYVLKNISSYTAPSAKVSENVNIKGNVYIDEEATVMDGVTIVGPAYIGKNVYIGTNAIIRNGVSIEEKSVVGAGMEVKNALIMGFSTTHSGFIGDSVIGQHAKIAAGFITANVRLDRGEITSVVKGEKVNTHYKNLGVMIGSSTSIGIHVGTMPGVIIGNNVVVGPSTTVMKNIPDDTTVYSEVSTVMEKRHE